MRVAPPPAPKPYQFQQYPSIQYPSTELQAKGVIRTRIANSETEEKALAQQGYQRTQAPPPYVAPNSTKEEALALQASVYDAAFRQKGAELAAVQMKLSALAIQFDLLKTDRDTLARKLAHLTKRPGKEEETEAAA